jgi:hypothetical protein
MKTSTDVKDIENYLQGTLDTPSKLLFEAKMLIDPALMSDVRSQRLVYLVVQILGRRKIKSEIEEVHNSLFNDPGRSNFCHSIYNLFTN